MKAQKGSRCIVLLIVNHGARCGWVVKTTPRPLYPRERDLVPILQEAGWVSGPMWSVKKIVRLTESKPRNTQHVASCCTDYAISAAKMYMIQKLHRNLGFLKIV